MARPAAFDTPPGRVLDHETDPSPISDAGLAPAVVVEAVIVAAVMRAVAGRVTGGRAWTTG